MRNIFCIIILLAAATSATAGEYFKHIDRNGIELWVDDAGKIPKPLPPQYSYEDKNGLTHWVTDANAIPTEYRKKGSPAREDSAKSESGPEQKPVVTRQYSTKISISENQIIVPVVFKNKGRKVKARMILDTGASVTTLYSVLASSLNLKNNTMTKVRSISANGAKTDSLLTKVDYIEVDDKILANSEVVIMPSHSNIGADGLLGNSFLRFFNFTIDYEKQLLRWN